VHDDDDDDDDIWHAKMYDDYIQTSACEEVTLQLINSKCLQVLLYGLENVPFNQVRLAVDFVINKFSWTSSQLKVRY